MLLTEPMFNKTTIKKNIHNTFSRKRGISLIIALLTTTLLLAISFSVGGIILRQFRIISTSVQSQIAFYAADSALDCSIYWDIISDDGSMNKVNVDGSNTYVFGITPPGGNPASIIKCGSDNAPAGLVYTADASIATTTFYLNYSTPQYPACAYVSIVKTPDRTFIETRGYNIGLSGNTCDLTNAVSRRIVERGLQYVH